jgi:uncharacterized membrane protein
MKQKQNLTFGQKAADTVAKTIGSWKFIIIQTSLILAWITYNGFSGRPYDPYPFILLNLMLSFQAAYTGPMVMMSQNRQAEIDRQEASADYSVNRIAKKEIEAIQLEISSLKSEIVGKNNHKKRLQKLVDRLEDVQGSLESSELKPTK